MSIALPHVGRLVSRAHAEIKSPADLLLVGRMLMWACALRLLKHVVRLPRLVRFVYQPAREVERDVRAEEHVTTLARWACRVLDWSSGGNCLERALVTYRYLSALNARPMLVVGVSTSAERKVEGHAWITVDGRPMGETPAALQRFAQVVRFGAEGRRVAAAG